MKLKYFLTVLLVSYGSFYSHDVLSDLKPYVEKKTVNKKNAIAEKKLKYQPSTLRLAQNSRYIRDEAAPDYWALMPYYTGQLTDGTCGVATVSMIANGIRASQSLFASDELVHEKRIFNWFNPMRVGSDKGVRGMSLPGIERVIQRVLSEIKMSGFETSVIRADIAKRDLVLKLLEQNEKDATDFVVALFWQADFTGDPEGAVGHIAPVGAYDKKQKRVLILDPDRRWYEPYWVTEDVFFKGIENPKADSIAPGGLIYIKKI